MEPVQLPTVNHVTHLQVRHIHILFIEYYCVGTNGRTGSRTNASHGRGTSEVTRRRGTSATDKCQSCNSSPSKTYTCTIFLNINI